MPVDPLAAPVTLSCSRRSAAETPSRTRRKKKGLALSSKPKHWSLFSLEAQFQTKLHIARNERARGLPECGITQLVVRASAIDRKQEVGAIENIEGLPLELQVHAFGELEGLGKPHIRVPLSRSQELV